MSPFFIRTVFHVECSINSLVVSDVLNDTSFPDKLR